MINTNTLIMKHLLIFAVLFAVVSCKQNPAESIEHKKLVEAHNEMKIVHDAMATEHNELRNKMSNRRRSPIGRSFASAPNFESKAALKL